MKLIFILLSILLLIPTIYFYTSIDSQETNPTELIEENKNQEKTETILLTKLSDPLPIPAINFRVNSPAPSNFKDLFDDVHNKLLAAIQRKETKIDNDLMTEYIAGLNKLIYIYSDTFDRRLDMMINRNAEYYLRWDIFYILDKIQHPELDEFFRKNLEKFNDYDGANGPEIGYYFERAKLTVNARDENFNLHIPYRSISFTTNWPHPSDVNWGISIKENDSPAKTDILLKNVFDNDPNTSWILDKNQLIKFEINQKTVKTSIRFRNGISKSKPDWNLYPRVKNFSIALNGIVTNHITLKDSQQAQCAWLVDMALYPGDIISIKILGVYPGTLYKTPAITDIVFINDRG